MNYYTQDVFEDSDIASLPPALIGRAKAIAAHLESFCAPHVDFAAFGNAHEVATEGEVPQIELILSNPEGDGTQMYVVLGDGLPTVVHFVREGGVDK